jgi:F-type H+-transporting ATPase subunit epsilon
MPVQLSIVTPEQSLVEASVDWVVAPGSEGEFGVLPLHEPYLVPLKAGDVRFQEGGQEHRVTISGGFAEVTQDRVTVLAQGAQEAVKSNPSATG